MPHIFAAESETLMLDIFIAAVSTALVASAGTPPAHPASCLQQFRDAGMVRPLSVEYPAITRLQGVTGTSLVRVDLNESGRVQNVYVTKSSGNRYLDKAALKAVNDGAFTPEIQDCRTVAGSYALEVTFER